MIEAPTAFEAAQQFILLSDHVRLYQACGIEPPSQMVKGTGDARFRLDVLITSERIRARIERAVDRERRVIANRRSTRKSPRPFTVGH